MKNRIPDSLTIQQYQEGTLDPRRMHELEKQSLEDNFLSDALEGYTYVIEPAEHLSLLQQRLSDRILVQEANKKAFGLTSHRLSIAAASGLMCILAVILFWMNGYKPDEATKQVEVSLSTQPLVESQSNAAKVSKHTAAIANSVASPIFTMAEKSLSRSEPVTGWNDYTQYIRTTIGQYSSRPLKNFVIAFKISQAGSPIDLKVVDGLPDEYSKKIMSAIENGPLWKPLDDKEVKVQIHFNK